MPQGLSMVMRHCHWVATADPIERAELFGRLDGIIDAICILGSATTLTEALEQLRALEHRYAQQYEGSIPTSDNTPATTMNIEVVI
ncbi:MAG: hypothetical protein P8171_13865 [Candidatus Thiodiazotropha sp.]